MTINTGVPNNLNRPQTFHTFSFFRAAGSLQNVPLRIALIGAQRSTATATVNTVTDLSNLSSTDVDLLYGQSSELALMFREALSCANLFQRGPRVFGVGIAESAGVANVQTITGTGAATAEGNIIIRVAGRTVLVGVANGATANAIAASISSELTKIQQTLPVLVTVATNVVTLTHATKGVNGVDVKITIDQQVTGNSLVLATTVVGSTATSIQPAIDALAPLRYDGIAIANHASADITILLADMATRWGASSKTWAFYFVGEMGTIGTATSLAAAANDKAFNVSSFEGCLNTAGEIATASAMLVFSRERPNASFDGAKVPLYPPPVGTIYTPSEVETAIAAGLTAYTAVVDSSGAVTQNLAKCERMITSKTTTSSFPDDKLRDIGIPRVSVALAIQLDIATAQRFGAEANPDGVFQTDDTKDQIKDMVSAIWRASAADNVINPKFVEADIAQNVVEFDTVTLGRTNSALFYHPVGSQHQIAFQHNATIGA